MCPPVLAAIPALSALGSSFSALSIASTALGAAGTVAGFAAERRSTNAYNAAGRENARNAGEALQRSYEQDGAAFAYESRANQQEAYKAALAGRAATATGRATAAASGLDLGSISVSDVLAETRATAAMNEANARSKQGNLGDSVANRYLASRDQAIGRINSMPSKSGPSVLGLAIGLGADALKGYSKIAKK